MRKTLETRVRSLGQEDPLAEEMATHRIMLVWKIPRIEEPDGLPSTGLQKVRRDWAAEHTYTCFKESSGGCVRVLMLRPSAVSDCEPKTVFPVGECVASSSALIVRACDHGRDGDSVYLRPQVTKMGGASYLQHV